MPKRTTRIYARSRNGTTRFYLDLRSLGGTQEALVAPGDFSATTDPDIAADLAAKRIKAFRKEKLRGSLKREESKRREVIDGLKGRWGLKAYCVHHLTQKARSGKVTEQWVENLQRNLECAANFFGENRDVASIGVADVEEYVAHLQALPNGRGGTLLRRVGPALPERTLWALYAGQGGAGGAARVQPRRCAHGQAGSTEGRTEVVRSR